MKKSNLKILIHYQIALKHFRKLRLIVVKTFKEKTSLRITIIDERGLVVADSDKDISKMKNHSNRYEILHAKNKNYGKKIRYSKSLNQELLYVAKKLIIKEKSLTT